MHSEALGLAPTSLVPFQSIVHANLHLQSTFQRSGLSWRTLEQFHGWDLSVWYCLQRHLRPGQSTTRYVKAMEKLDNPTHIFQNRRRRWPDRMVDVALEVRRQRPSVRPIPLKPNMWPFRITHTLRTYITGRRNKTIPPNRWYTPCNHKYHVQKSCPQRILAECLTSIATSQQVPLLPPSLKSNSTILQAHLGTLVQEPE
jgi:hypothetical protein